MINKNHNFGAHRKSDWYKKWTGLSEKDARRIEELLLSDELIEYVTTGWVVKDNKKNAGFKGGKLIVTSRRVFCWTPSIIGKRYSMEEYPYDKISSINFNRGLLLGTIEIFASNNKVQIGNIPNQYVEPATNIIRKNWNAKKDTTSIISNEDPIEKIKKLKGLLDIGILSQDEYEKKKKELLERI